MEEKKGFFTVGLNRNSPARLYYELYGSNNAKNKVIFVHGLLQPGSSWKIQIDYFKKLPDFQICVYDNRGIGNSNSISFSTKHLAHDAIDLIKCLNWKNANIVGTSLGGSVCFYVSNIIEKELVNSIIISAPWIGAFSHVSNTYVAYNLFGTLFIKDKRKKFRTWIDLFFSKNYLNSKSITDPKHTKGEAMLERFLNNKIGISFKAKNPISLFSSIFSFFAHSIPNSIYNDIGNKPFLKIGIIACKHDRVVNFNQLKTISQKIKAYKFYEVESGHNVHIERSDDFCKIIEDHVKDTNVNSFQYKTLNFQTRNHNFNSNFNLIGNKQLLLIKNILKVLK
ncbi:hypothetical protein ACTFIU_000885 [Dictyostelium citrinum]